MTNAARPKPSPEVRAMLAQFARVNREKYGENWPSVVAGQVAEKTAPVIAGLMKLRKDRA